MALIRFLLRCFLVETLVHPVGFAEVAQFLAQILQSLQVGLRRLRGVPALGFAQRFRLVSPDLRFLSLKFENWGKRLCKHLRGLRVEISENEA